MSAGCGPGPAGRYRRIASHPPGPWIERWVTDATASGAALIGVGYARTSAAAIDDQGGCGGIDSISARACGSSLGLSTLVAVVIARQSRRRAKIVADTTTSRRAPCPQ